MPRMRIFNSLEEKEFELKIFQYNMEKIIKKDCKIHGNTEFVLRSDKRYRCKKCAMDAVNKRRNKIKNLSIEYKGGKCEKCD